MLRLLRIWFGCVLVLLFCFPSFLTRVIEDLSVLMDGEPVLGGVSVLLYYISTVFSMYCICVVFYRLSISSGGGTARIIPPLSTKYGRRG